MGGAAETVANLVRQGLITPQEIADRMVQRKGAEQQNQLRAEQLTPEAVQARQAQTQLQGETAKAGMEILPLQTQAAKMTAQDAIKDQEFGGAISAYRKLAPLVGQTGGQPTLPDGSPDYATMAAKGAEWQQAFVQQQIANERLKVAERVQTEGPAGEKGVKFLNALGEDVTPDPGNQTFQGYAKQARAFESFRALPKGGSATSAVTPVEGAGASVPATSVVTPVKGAGVAVPATSGYNPQMGMMTGATPAKEYKAPTEMQMRDIFMTARSKGAEKAFGELEKKGFRPESLLMYLQNALPNWLQSGDAQSYNAAMQMWAQGVLRMESGAAISRHEEAWYKRTFFTMPGDKPQTIELKKRLRNEYLATSARIAGAGPIDPRFKEEAQKELFAAQDRIEQQVLASKRISGAVTTKSERQVLPSGQIVYHDPTTGKLVGIQDSKGNWIAGSAPAGVVKKGQESIVAPKKANQALRTGTPPTFSTERFPVRIAPLTGP